MIRRIFDNDDDGNGASRPQRRGVPGPLVVIGIIIAGLIFLAGLFLSTLIWRSG
jgi:hypothetical protein